MKKISYLFLTIAMMVLLVACGDNQATANNDKKEEKSKYKIENLSSYSVTDADFERFYNQAKNAAFSWIDDLGENDYLGPEKASMTVFTDNSVAFLLSTVDKPDIDDDTVLVTFHYDSDQNEYIRGDIQYNKHQYNKN
ncbi:hypothetical protein UMC2_35291 [[Clostridium] sordellii]|uniref:hypothetical protein n=1 Tax=Paraclostridium sordellii TaxID=1505 RepID=UPI000542C0D0|nr:hypothetical protein [Paeniclostridium sordellii]CEK34318.1 hypothetical protein UMC2_35291 [[Clostridium] sordellii] [Paeniclostridium sordellii]